MLINYHSPYQHTETTVAVSYNFLWPSYLCVIANDSEHVNVRTVIAKYPNTDVSLREGKQDIILQSEGEIRKR